MRTPKGGVKDLKPRFTNHYRVRHDAFCAMVNASFEGKFDMSKTLNEWWVEAFRSPFPKEGLTVEEATMMIQYKLLGDDADYYEVELGNTFKQNKEAALERRMSKFTSKMRSVLKCLRLSEARQTIIYQTEAGMARSTKVESKTVETKKVEKKQPVFKKAEEASDLAASLLLKRDFTDKEVADQVNDEFPGASYTVKTVKGTRKWMNDNAKQWYKKLVNEPLEEIVYEDDEPETLKEKPVRSSRSKKEVVEEEIEEEEEEEELEELEEEDEPEEKAPLARKPRLSRSR